MTGQAAPSSASSPTVTGRHAAQAEVASRDPALDIAWDIAWAAPGQTAAVLTLLPALRDAMVHDHAPLPPRLAVAHVRGARSQLLGAAVFVPVLHRGPSPGFRGLVQVLPRWQRRGLGRALVARLAAEVAAWDVPHLLSWRAEVDSEASRFMQALGFRVDHRIHHFLIDKTLILPACERQVARLQARGRVPSGYRLLPLAQVPRAAWLALHTREFNADPEPAAAMLALELADPLVQSLSFGLWDGRSLAGYLLAGRSAAMPEMPEMPEVRFWASDPALRSGWAAAMVLRAFVHGCVELGFASALYQCNANALAPLNVARRSGATELAVTQAWALDLGPGAASAVAVDMAMRAPP